MKNFANFGLLIIIVLGFLLRFVYLDKFPPSPNWDEVSHGYNAYSILKTGKDEWGITLPLIFRAYGDYKLPFYIYASVIPIWLFGLNTFALRLPSVFAGVGSIVLTYFLVFELLKQSLKVKLKNIKIAALLSSFLVAVEPWSFFLSRGAFEANLSLFLFLVGIYSFLKGLKDNRLFPLSVIFLGLTVWTYNSYRIFTPIMVLLLVFLYVDEIKNSLKKSPVFLFLSFFLVIVFFLPMFYQLVSTEGRARYEKLEIIDTGTVAQIIESRHNSRLNPLLSRILYNKPVYFLKSFTVNWLSHFSPIFLFFEGGNNYQFSIPGQGILYLINLPFIILGLFCILRGLLEKDKYSKLLLIWFILAPIPSSITREAPHVLRSITMLPLPMIFSAIGFIFFLEKIVKWKGNIFKILQISSDSIIYRNWHKVIVWLYLGIIIIASVKYLSLYFINYSKEYSWVWQYGYKEVVNYAIKNYENYEKIITTKKYGEPHEFFLFFSRWDPAKYQNDANLIRFYQSNWYWVDRFDKYYFVNDWDIPREGYKLTTESKNEIDCSSYKSKCLLITSPGNAPNGWLKLETIYFLNGEPAFELYDNSANNLGYIR